MPRVYSGRDCGKFIEPLIRNARRRLWIVSPYISREYAELLVEKAHQGVDVRVVTCDVDESRDAIRVLRLGVGRVLVLLGVVTLAVFVAANIMHFAGLRGVDSATLAISGLLAIVCNLLLLILNPRLWLAMLCATVAIAIALSNYLKIPLLRLLLNAVIIYQGYASAAALIALSMHRPRIALVTYPSASPKTVSRAIPISSTVGYSTTYQPSKPQLKIVPPERMVHSKIYIGDDIAIVGSANLTHAGLWRNYETITIFEGEEVREVEKMFLEIWNSV